jgi:hypothetical protein
MSDTIYVIYANRNTSEFDQKDQEMRVKVLEAHSNYFIVESLKRYNKKYSGASVSTSQKYFGRPVRRINFEQIIKIVEEKTNKELQCETVRRREGTPKSPGRAKGGK